MVVNARAILKPFVLFMLKKSHKQLLDALARQLEKKDGLSRCQAHPVVKLPLILMDMCILRRDELLKPKSSAVGHLYDWYDLGQLGSV